MWFHNTYDLRNVSLEKLKSTNQLALLYNDQVEKLLKADLLQ